MLAPMLLSSVLGGREVWVFWCIVKEFAGNAGLQGFTVSVFRVSELRLLFWV